MTHALNQQFTSVPLPTLKAVLSIIGLLSLTLVINLSLYLQPARAFVTPTYNEQFLIDATNEERVAKGQKALRYNPLLAEAAQAKAADMIINGYFDHTSPVGKTPWSFIKGAGYDYLRAGENLAIDFTSVKSVTGAWMKSPAHRANILKSNYEEIGIAEVIGRFQGRETMVVVQVFGTKPFSLTSLFSQ